MHVPPLRDRREDIVYLANAFMRATAARLAKPLNGLTSGAERLLREADWPGNVRELRNVIERACLMAEGRLVGELDVKASLPAPRASRVAAGLARAARRPSAGRPHTPAARTISSRCRTWNASTSCGRCSMPTATRRRRRRCSA